VKRSALGLAASLLVVATSLFAPGCNRGPSCPPGATLMGEPPPDGQEIWCQKTGGGAPVKEGLFRLYYPNGSTMIEGQYHDGKQIGEWKTWFQNGQQSAIDHYTGGVQDGPHSAWYDNGQPAAQGNYVNGKREGIWKRWDPNGFRNWEETWKDDQKIS
jgi:hypothetical protein